MGFVELQMAEHLLVSREKAARGSKGFEQLDTEINITVRMDIRIDGGLREVWMHIESEALLESLHRSILALACGKVSEITLSSPGIHVAGGIKLAVLRVSEGRHRTKNISLVANNGAVAVAWVHDTSGWLDMAGLLDGLLGSDQPGHQYMTNSEADDTTIVISNEPEYLTAM